MQKMLQRILTQIQLRDIAQHHSASVTAAHTFDTITFLDRAQHFELLQHIDSVVQHVEDYWNENGKADSPGGAS